MNSLLKSGITIQKREFHSNIRAINRIGPHNLDTLSVIFGSLLGNGNMKRLVEGCMLVVRETNKDYAQWLYHFFYDRGYTSNLHPRQYTRRLNSKEGKEYYGYEFNTFTFRSFNWIHKKFYYLCAERSRTDPCGSFSPKAVNRRGTLPLPLPSEGKPTFALRTPPPSEAFGQGPPSPYGEERVRTAAGLGRLPLRRGGKRVLNLDSKYLTPLALAVFSMSRATYLNDCIELYIGRKWEEKDIMKMCQLLNSCFELDSSIRKLAKNKFAIVISKESVKRFQTIVSPYFIPTLNYKIGLCSPSSFKKTRALLPKMGGNRS